MYQSICNFMALAGEVLTQKLENEFQYRMNLSDGEYLFWERKVFENVTLEPALTAEAQAILQYFSSCACPFSMLRLGRSLSERNVEHGPIISDSLALQYLLKGLEVVDNNLYDDRIKVGMFMLIESPEFKAACDLIISYERDIEGSIICPEIRNLIYGQVIFRSKRLQ